MADSVSLLFKLLGDSSGAEDAFDKVDGKAKDTEGKLSKFSATAGAVGAAAGGLLAAGFATNVGLSEGQAKITAQLGLTKDEAGKAGQAAAAVYGDNWGGSIDEVNDAIKSVAQNISDVRSTSTADLSAMSERALALSQAFGTDVAESTRAVGSLLKNGLAKDSAEAFDIITAGMQMGTDKAGDLLDTFTEYSPQFAKLGITGTQALGILQDGLKGGARDTDVIADSFKEFGIRAIDGSKTTADGFKLLGLNAKDAAAEIGKGGEAANGMTQEVLARLDAIKDPVKQNAAGVALFGTTWEDTVRQILPAIKDMGDASDITLGSSDQLMKTLGTSGKATVDGYVRSVQTWVASMEGGSGPISTLTAGVAEFGGQGVGMVSSLVGIGAGLSQMNIGAVGARAAQLAGSAATGVATAAQWLWNAALSANPIGLVVLAIAALVAGLVWFFTQTTLGREIFSAAMNGITTAFGWVWDKAQALFGWVKSNWPLLLAIITGPIGLAVLAISKHWDTITGGVQAAKTKITNFASGMFDGIKNSFKTAINFVIKGWNALHFSVPSFSFAGITTPGFNLGLPQLPYLATGGIVTGPTLAMLGDNTSGREAVVPLERAGEMGFGGTQIHVHVTAGAVGSEAYLAQTVVDTINLARRRGQLTI